MVASAAQLSDTFAAILTSSKYHATRCQLIKQTWAALVPPQHYLFYSDQADSTLPAIALQVDSGFYKALWHKVWPPSWESAPFLIGCGIFTLVVTVLSFRASSQSEEAKRSIEKKRKLIVAQLSQAM